MNTHKIPSLTDRPDLARIATEQTRTGEDLVLVSELIAGAALWLDLDAYVQDAEADSPEDRLMEHAAIRTLLRDGYVLHLVVADAERYNLTSNPNGYSSPLFAVALYASDGRLMTHDEMYAALDKPAQAGLLHLLPTVWIGKGQHGGACGLEKARDLLGDGRLGGTPRGLVWRVERYPDLRTEPGRAPYVDFFVKWEAEV